MIPKSIRWRLPLSYAAIALLATLALGLVMLLILRSYYLQRERTYLNGNAAVISQELINLIEPDIDPLLLASQLRSFSFLSQTQIRFLDPAGVMIVDSGNPQERRDLIALSVDMDIEAKGDQLTLPDEIDPNSPTEGFQSFIFLQDEVSDGPAKTEDVSAQLNGEVTITSTRKTHLSLFNGEQEVVERQIVHQTGPLSLFSAVGTPYGFGLNLDAPTSANAPRSDQMVLYPVREPGGTLHGYIELSNGPAYGRDVLTSVIWGWAIASGVAVVLAAGTGWLISRRLSAPLLALTITTARMAAGDLSTRTSIRRDDEVGTLAQTFNEMADQVEETVVALRRFVADAAHELNTPLTALRTNLELSLHESELPSQTAFLERAQLQVVRLENLTGDLLDLSRLEANADRTGQQAVDLSSLLRAATEPYASRAEQANLNFQLIQPTSAVIIHGDEDQLRRALSNLLDNALKFTPEGGRITVGLQVNDQTTQVWIEDTGIGIPPEDLPQLFSRFHRGRNTAAYPGSGLGLAIVKAIADHHQGRVEVVSTPGGTRFNLWLPS